MAGLIMAQQRLGDRLREAFIQMEADANAPHRAQIDRLTVAESFDGQAEAAEDALHRQADDGDQFADPVGLGEGMNLAEDDASEFADAVVHARSALGIDSQTGQFPDI